MNIITAECHNNDIIMIVHCAALEIASNSTVDISLTDTNLFARQDYPFRTHRNAIKLRRQKPVLKFSPVTRRIGRDFCH